MAIRISLLKDLDYELGESTTEHNSILPASWIDRERDFSIRHSIFN